MFLSDPGEDPSAVLGDKQQHGNLPDHLQDDNFLVLDLMRCLGFRYVYFDEYENEQKKYKNVPEVTEKT